MWHVYVACVTSLASEALNRVTYMYVSFGILMSSMHGAKDSKGANTSLNNALFCEPQAKNSLTCHY